jgi:hypothetical protein
MEAEKSPPAGSAPPVVVRIQGSDRSLPAGPSYLIGRDPDCDIVIADGRVSWRHAVLGVEQGRWVLADNGSTNGTYARGPAGQPSRDRRPARDPAQPSVHRADAELRGRARDRRRGNPSLPPPPPPAPPSPSGPLEIPYAVRWLVPRGERFANFDILNDTETQLDYYRRFGHIYAVGVPAKKWRLVVVSDPELLDEVAENIGQFGKRVEEINFFAQLSNSRGGGISVIGDGEHYEQVRRVMLPCTRRRTSGPSWSG